MLIPKQVVVGGISVRYAGQVGEHLLPTPCEIVISKGSVQFGPDSTMCERTNTLRKTVV